MTVTKVVETSVTVNNSPIQFYDHPDDNIPSTEEMTPRFRPFTNMCIEFNSKIRAGIK